MSSPPAPRTKLVLVTGSGRSGTSTAAGALKRLGMYVPQPEIPPDDTNPRGFYEPQWVVEFHKRLLSSLPVRTNDARPRVAELTRELGEDPAVKDQLEEWLGVQVASAQGSDLVIKDPRAFWLADLWKGAARSLGIDLAFLTMLRHPVEVAQSRETHYLKGHTERFRRVRQTASIAGWLNGAFETELATRGFPRAFVRYVDLMADWRAALEPTASHLGLALSFEMPVGETHPVDDFIDSTLRRTRVTWDDVETQPELQELAQTAWDAVNRLVEDPQAPDALSALDAAKPRYARLHDFAEAVALDHTNCEVVKERRRVRAKVQTLRKKLHRAREQASSSAPDQRAKPDDWLRSAMGALRGGRRARS